MAAGQSGVRAYTDSTGSYIIPSNVPAGQEGQVIQGVLWSYRNNFFAIPDTVCFSGVSQKAWAGMHLNNQRLQRFDVPGDGTPTDLLVGSGSLARVAGSNGSDLVVYTGGPDAGPYNIQVLGSTDTAARWNFNFPPNYNNSYASEYNAKVSRDGSTVAVGVNGYDQILQQSYSAVYVFNADGTQRNVLQTTGMLTGVDLNDNGSLCIVADINVAKLFDTSTAQMVFSTGLNGAGGRHAISGDGSVLALGAFNLVVFTKVGSNYQQAFQYSSPNCWFGWGVAVSRDGTTVGAMNHDYAQNYCVNNTRIWDVASRTLLGEHPLVGGGQFQGSISGASMSDNGQVFAVSSWGVENNAFPEVMVFDRSVALIDSADTFGSVFGLDCSADGRYVVAGSKGSHANQFGNGGDVTLLALPGGCPADFNGDNQVDFFDYLDFAQAFSEEDPSADFNGDNQIDFFDYLDFAQAFAEGCS
jgi:hypothetical protein